MNHPKTRLEMRYRGYPAVEYYLDPSACTDRRIQALLNHEDYFIGIHMSN